MHAKKKNHFGQPSYPSNHRCKRTSSICAFDTILMNDEIYKRVHFFNKWTLKWTSIQMNKIHGELSKTMTVPVSMLEEQARRLVWPDQVWPSLTRPRLVILSTMISIIQETKLYSKTPFSQIQVESLGKLEILEQGRDSFESYKLQLKYKSLPTTIQCHTFLVPYGVKCLTQTFSL